VTGWALRLILAALLVSSGWQVLHQLVAVQAARFLPGVEGLHEAIRWDPEGTDYHLQLGRYHQAQLLEEERSLARPAFERAAELNPYEPSSRQELALIYEVEGRRAEAERLLLEAVALRPTSGQMYWLLGNFYLRSGDLPEALPALRKTMEAEPGLVRAATNLLLGIGVEPSEVEHLVPRDARARRQLLDVLSERLEPGDGNGILFATLRVWHEQLEAGTLGVSQGAFVINRLLRADLPDIARREWAALNLANGRADHEFASGENAIWNGDLDLPVEGGELDWLLPKTAVYEAVRARREGVDDSAALRVDYSGEVPGGLRRLQQRVVLEPGLEYSLRAVVRTQGLDAKTTPRLEIVGDDMQRRLAISERFEPGGEWHEVESRFTAPDTIAPVVIRLADAARSRLEGSVWIDSIDLRPIR
jgi:hypothetical protein